MQLIEKQMNLFEVEDKYYFAHCISSDFALGKGIAVEFNNRFRMKSKLLNQYGSICSYPECILIDKVFNLVTKSKYYGKPTYESISSTIEMMKYICVRDNIKFVAMPKIGCGLDRLSWGKVREIITEVFKDTDIEILVCSL